MIKVFVDTDVIISSSLSKTGAAYQLLGSTTIQRFVSNFSTEEAQRTANKLGISIQEVSNQLNLCTKVEINKDLKSIIESHNVYVNDPADSHVVAGAIESKSLFLATYNLKDFRAEYIKRELDIIVLTPGTLLQFLRSRK